jgi:hypothetical protein
MKKPKFSFFASSIGIKNITPGKEIDLSELFRILQSERLKEHTQLIRETTDIEVKKKLKNKLPYITPYGTFEERRNNKITTYNSNLIALDFDNLNTFQLSYIRGKLINSKRAYYVGTSPRGEGIKALIFAGCEFDPETHYESLKCNEEAILKYLGIEGEKLDCNMFKLSQGFFLCYDEKAYFNLDPFTLIEGEEKLRPYKKQSPVYNRLITPSQIPLESKDRIERFLNGLFQKLSNHYLNTTEGNRHNSIAKVKNFAGYIRTYLPEKEEEYKQRLFTYINSMYSQKEQSTSRVKESFESAWIEDKNGYCEELEKINIETLKLKEVVNCFFNGVETEYIGKDYKNNETIDKVQLTEGGRGVQWIYKNGNYSFTLAFRYTKLHNGEIFIKLLGIPLPDKLERLNLLPNVSVKYALNILFLNGKEWNGVTEIVKYTSQSVSI